MWKTRFTWTFPRLTKQIKTRTKASRELLAALPPGAKGPWKKQIDHQGRNASQSWAEEIKTSWAHTTPTKIQIRWPPNCHRKRLKSCNSTKWHERSGKLPSKLWMSLKGSSRSELKCATKSLHLRKGSWTSMTWPRKDGRLLLALLSKASSKEFRLSHLTSSKLKFKLSAKRRIFLDMLQATQCDHSKES